ncbi:MAG: VCBS repeat-containing protein [candidate division Zixibacteria bacterium]|nr:VCBS repeat-containing protein [candidate division Zixibacteria bacterium]MBU2625599.1 VCBS repeat-containing protein [candidate division Zixibacteria bacterium]
MLERTRLAMLFLLLSLLIAGCSNKSNNPFDNNNQHDPQDETPPAAVTDLAATAVTDSSITLSWTSTFDTDNNYHWGFGYIIYYADFPLSTSNLTSAMRIVHQMIDPKDTGETETFKVSNLYSGTQYYFATRLEGYDKVTALSNIVIQKTGSPDTDNSAPAAITDLIVTRASRYSVLLEWTAPADDGPTEGAFQYDIRYYHEPINIQNWEYTNHLEWWYDLVPSPAGTHESLLIGDLWPGQTYYFAIRSRDEHPNQWSSLSNSDSATTYLAEEDMFDVISPSTLEVEFWGSYATAADFDHDGDVDLAVIREGESMVALIENDGQGNLTHSLDMRTASWPILILSARLNADQYDDIVTMNEFSNSISILLNSGNGTFAAHVDYPIGYTSYSFVAADLNGDAIDDIACVHHVDTNNVLVLLNNGYGAFSGPQSYVTGTPAYDIEAADIDNRGINDLLIATGWSLVKLTNNGNGTFSDDVEHFPGIQAYTITATLLNGDNSIDLLATETMDYQAYLSVYLNDGAGSLIFDNRSLVAADINTDRIEAIDLDNDLKTDLVGPGYSGFSFLPGLGDGSFQPADYYVVPEDYTTGGLTSICPADFDNDGDIDIATVNPRLIRIYFNRLINP